MAEPSKPYYAPNGLRVVKLTTHRFGVHNPGEVGGFEDKTAQVLVDKGWANDHTPSADVVAKHEKEKAKAKAVAKAAADAADAELAPAPVKAPAK